MKVIVDTNVPIVANKAAIQASGICVLACVRWLNDIQCYHTLVLDDGWYILREYMGRLRSEGQPGVGDAFLKWVLTNRSNPLRCEQVHITAIHDPLDGRAFSEFPDDAALAGFDRSDRKFVAVAQAHPEHPSILNAVDPDWWQYYDALLRHGIRIEFICPDAMTS